MQGMQRWVGGVIAAGAVIFAGQVWLNGQPPAAGKTKATDPNRLQFEVVQSFDGKYLGDTPGHMGRVGGLTGRKPQVALGDPIFRGEERVGVVTGLEWNRVNGSLDIEFDPVDHARVCVGDEVWMSLDAKAATPTPAR
jgi:hypothetical protein